METNNEVQKFDYKTLSLKKQYLWKLCKQILRDLKNGECTEEEIDAAMANLDHSKQGYFREEDFVTADEGMRILNLGQNRNKFFDLIQTNNIKARTFKGTKIGYRRHEIELLKQKI